MKTFKVIVFIFTIVNLFSCKKENNQATLPPATQNGSNTMGAYINNVIWVPTLSFYDTGIQADYGSTVFSILGLSENSNHLSKTSVYVALSNFNGMGSYTLNAFTGSLHDNYANVSMGSAPSDQTYITDSLHQGNVTITHFDPNKGIVSGTFQLKLVNQFNSSDTINVTNGRFDVTCPLNQF